MSAARHHVPSGTFTDEQLRTDITDDIGTFRGAQQSLQQAGQYGQAAAMGQANDENLDELNALNNGTWKPNHA
ncbi:hypothetical protein [Streptomyces mirabilis]|uniref:hypothetical protein n=1 Tax=Streptomyces mirabilis TaxID=68239 RepID=UPI0036743FF1